MADLKITMRAKLVIIILIGLGLRIYPIVTEQVFFHFDSARDWLWVRDIVMNRKPPLVGPWSSLSGVFYGPLTYYLLVPFFVVFGGDPIGGSVQALFMQVAAMGWFYVLMRRVLHPRAAAISLFLLAISPQTVYISTFIFQSNPSFGLGVMWLWGIYMISRKKNLGVIIAMLTLGLGVHTNLFFTVILLPFLGLWLWFKRWQWNLKILAVSLLAFILPLVPQIAFELRHEFLQTKSLWRFRGTDMDFVDRIRDRSGAIWAISK